jgi:arginine/lysine/ornithine decarboxylase
MDTPIYRFLEAYAEKDPVRLHMPGHKGQGSPVAPYDLTEVEGADSLYEAGGIIAESERNAGQLFGCHTFYSTEGSSLAIRAMLYLAALDAKSKGQAPRIVAGRNAHKVFLSAVALLELAVTWLAPKGSSYLSCPITADDVREALTRDPSVTAVYLTSPDYLGNTVDLKAIAAVCHQHGVLLLVDNAHGAYLKFLPQSRHPMDLGADLCCDSAHKTLPTLTGCAYLHIAKTAPAFLAERAKQALGLFGSTSPSYLMLASLDAVNRYLAEDFRRDLTACAARVERLKTALIARSYTLVGDEPMKITIAPKAYGYRGTDLSRLLAEQGFVAEFADPDHLTLMLSPAVTEQLDALKEALTAIPRGDSIVDAPPVFSLPQAVLPPREAILSEAEELPAADCLGRILAAVTVGCPPAVPIVVSGERIEKVHLDAFAYYGITTCWVVKA